MDVESGALHSLDKCAFDVARALENSGSPQALPYPKADIDEILAEFDSLKAAGAFDAPEPEPPTPAPPAIKAMCLHIAHDCNLRCKYCFAGTGEFHGERMLMTERVGRAALEFLMRHSGGRHDLEVDLFGGEPLINFSVVKAIVAYGRELEQKYGKHINFTCTTNGVALDDEKIDFLNREMHNMVLSLDGRREIHDAMRPTPNGRGSYDIILKNAKALVERRGDREYYVRGTFTNRNLDFTEDVKALLAEGFKQISIEPVVLPQSSEYALTAEHLPQIEAEYDRLADFVLQSRRDKNWFNFFHFMVDMQHSPCLAKRVSGCGAGAEYVAVTPEGDLYPCHQFVGEEGFRLGSVMEEGLNEGIRSRFFGCNILTKPECRTCWAKYFCCGGCAANAHKYNGNIAIPHQMTCALEKKRTECALAIYAIEKGEQ